MENKLKKVKNIYYAEIKEEKELIGGEYCTGLVIELEDGRMFRAQSSDVLMPFEQIEPLERIPEEDGHILSKEGYEKMEALFNHGKQVEPLQNGEREELDKYKFYDVLDEMAENARIHHLSSRDSREMLFDYVVDLLSQSKKEAVKNLFTDEEWDLILYGVSSNAFKDTGDYDRLRKMIKDEDGNVDGHYIYKYDLLLDKVRSLTNQKKENE